MKKFMSRAFGALATLAVALTLAACGGGGGGGNTPPPVTCTAPQVNVNGVCTTPPTDTTKPVLTLATASPASLTTTVTVTSNEDLGGNVAIIVKNGAATVAGATTLNQGNLGMTWTPSAALACNTAYTVNASASDVAGNVGTATFTVTTVGCPDTALHYTDKVVVVWGIDNYPHVVGLSGSSYTLTRLTNTTGKTLGSCGVANKPLTDGRVLVQCTTSGATPFERLTYSVNLNTVTLSSFTGTVPSDITFTVVDVSSAQPVVGTTSAHVIGGWYYADPSVRWHLLFQNDSGGTPLIVKNGTFDADGDIKVIHAYSN